MYVKMRLTVVSALVVVFLIMSCPCVGWAENLSAAGELATVGGERVTAAEFAEEIKNYAKNGNLPERMMTLTVDGRKRILDRITRERLLFMAARSENIKLDANTEKYLERLRRNLVIKQYLKEKMAAQPVSEAEMRVVYDADPKKFAIPEKRRVRHIVVASKAEAVKLKAQMQGAEKFAEFAGKYNVDGTREKQGELGWIRPQTMVEEFSKAAFSLPLNQISEPVKTTFGYHLILVEEIKPGVTRDFNRVKPQLRKLVFTCINKFIYV